MRDSCDVLKYMCYSLTIQGRQKEKVLFKCGHILGVAAIILYALRVKKFREIRYIGTYCT